jgi:hypothetical protein
MIMFFSFPSFAVFLVTAQRHLGCMHFLVPHIGII